MKKKMFAALMAACMTVSVFGSVATVSAADRGPVQGRAGASGDGATEAVNYRPETSTRYGQKAAVSTKTAIFIQCA